MNPRRRCAILVVLAVLCVLAGLAVVAPPSPSSDVVVSPGNVDTRPERIEDSRRIPIRVPVSVDLPEKSEETAGN